MANTSAVSSIPAEATATLRGIRTKCLTCRERHRKCDEGVPDCQDCKKSNRECKRDLLFNFINSTIKTLPTTPPTEDCDVIVQDESREIASEYQGGLSRYSALGTDVDVVTKEKPAFHSSRPVLQVPTRVLFGDDTVNCHVNGRWTPYEFVKDAISAPITIDGFHAAPDIAIESRHGQRTYTQYPASQPLQRSDHALPAKTWSSTVDYSSVTPLHHTYPKNLSYYQPQKHFPNVCPSQGSQPPILPWMAQDILSSHIHNSSSTISMPQLPTPRIATTRQSQPPNSKGTLCPSDQTPLYVNAKQYGRILKRRAARDKFKKKFKVPEKRKSYVHESRHRHAIERPRGPGGRYLSAEAIDQRKTESNSRHTNWIAGTSTEDRRGQHEEVVQQGGRAEKVFKLEASQNFNGRNEHQVKLERHSELSKAFTTSFNGAEELEVLLNLYPC